MPRNYNRRCKKGGAHKGCAAKPDLSVYASPCNGLPLDAAWNKSAVSASANSKQVGGGYFLDVGAKLVGGQAPVTGYSDCCPPAFKTTNATATNAANGSTGSASQAATAGMGAGFSDSGVMLSTTGKPLCGGGSRKRRGNSNKNKNKSSKNRNRNNRNSNRKRNRNMSKKRKGSKNRKSVTSKKRNRNRKRRTRSKQKGGAQGLPSVFTPDMSQRTFNCKQPAWDPKCI